MIVLKFLDGDLFLLRQKSASRKAKWQFAHESDGAISHFRWKRFPPERVRILSEYEPQTGKVHLLELSSKRLLNEGK